MYRGDYVIAYGRTYEQEQPPMWQPAQPTLKGHPERYLFAAHTFCYSVITVRTENGGHRNMRNAITVPPFVDEWKGELPLFSLDGLLPLGRALSVNTDCLVVSLALTHAANGNPILLQRPLTELQMRLLLPLLESPHYCPHEVLYMSLFCSCQGLFAGLFSPKRAAGEEWRAVVQEARLHLEHAQAQAICGKELKQIYNWLSEL